MVAEMSGRTPQEVRVVVSPYRICPLGAHVDHQVSSKSVILMICIPVVLSPLIIHATFVGIGRDYNHVMSSASYFYSNIDKLADSVV